MNILIPILTAIVALASILLLFSSPFILAAILLVLILLSLKLRRTKKDYYFLLVGAAMGTVAEILSIHFGAWSYAHPTFLGIPAWLPLGWALGVLLIKKITDCL